MIMTVQSSFVSLQTAYRCKTCGMSDSSCMCVECFDVKQHEGHDYRIYQSPSGGCCDCGDPSAWRPSGFCARHRGPASLLNVVAPESSNAVRGTCGD